MRKLSKGSRFLAMLLVLAMTFSMAPLSAFAAKGDVVNAATGTGLTGNIDTSDTISLPIRIMDYEADGMLFEFAESNGVKTPLDFGGKFYQDTDTVGDIANTASDGAFDDVTVAAKSNANANWVRMTYAGKTNNNWTQNNSAVWISTYSHKNSSDKWIDVIGENLTDMEQIRYVTIVYRSNVASDKIAFAFGDSADEANTSGRYTDGLTFSNKGDDGLGSDTNWTYAVYDLKNGSLANKWGASHPLISDNPSRIYISLPLDASNEWIDMSYVAFFSNKDMAKAFGEYALTDGSDRGDNRGFGLLRGSRKEGSNGTAANGLGGNFDGIFAYNNQAAEYGNAAGTVEQVAWKETAEQAASSIATVANLGYKLLGTYGAKTIANIGLLESSLSDDGYPVYKEEVVTYLAYLLEHSLEIPERTDGWKNYRYVQGTASSVYGGTDLATALRNAIDNKTISNGHCDAAKEKNLVGTWSAVSGNISTYHDAAYFLLNSIFVGGSYNEVQPYDYLVLSAGIDAKTGDKTYVFDGGFVNTTNPDTKTEPAITYDKNARTIQNNSAVGKAHYYFGDDSVTNLNPFLPIVDKNTEDDMTKNIYYQDDGVIKGVQKQETPDSLYKSNFGFAVATEGEFVYHADDELFFEFEGDDDVYLFINNELVLDLGSAHSISSVRFNLNDYVNEAKAGTLGSDTRNAALALEEGGTYTFKFYYMERHSYGSNIRISTNIRVTDPAMQTEKLAWQGGQQLDFGSLVNADGIVEYGFAITNTGDENLVDLSFTDSNIGVALDQGKGLNVTGSRVFDVNGGILEASDLTAVITHPNYSPINVTFADNNALKEFLQNLTAAGTEAGAGLFTGATVQIRGIGYKLSDAEKTARVFDNTVLTEATNMTHSKKLQGQASMRVNVPGNLMYYQWAGNKLVVDKDKLFEAIAPEVNLTAGNVKKVQLVTKSGTAITNPNVSIDGSYNMTINYPAAGSYVIYLKVNDIDAPVPVAINVTSVQDSVFVLDYGLNVDLTQDNELFKNDVLTVPGRDTAFELEGMTTQTPSYSPNKINFPGAQTGELDGNDGKFTISGNTMKYLPKNFLESLEKVHLAIRVHEKDYTANVSKIGTVDINEEVEMYKNITVVPANVVYYEDNFPAITYTGYENQFEDLGNQSANQDENYGSDEAYDNAGDASLGSLATITIDNNDVKASFQFNGTGFELIGRTNATDSATLIAKVLDASGNIVKNIPVITEFDHNKDDAGAEAIYQVPVVRVNNLPQAQYTVEISGVPARNYNELGDDGTPKIIPTKLYIDGLRIYQPSKDAEQYYNDTEKNAEFVEIRKQIVAGDTAVVGFSAESGLTINSATMTWTEDPEGRGLKHANVESVNDYLLQGPNNEVYMYGDDADAAIVFYVVPEDGANTKSLQVAVRAIDDGLFFSGVPNKNGAHAQIKYGSYKDGKFSWTPLTADPITSSTEQYYTINLENCYLDEEKGAYQVVLWVEEGMASFSSLKLVGLDLYTELGAEETDLQFINGTLFKYNEDEADVEARWVEADPAKYVNFAALSEQFGSNLVLEPQTSAKDTVQKPVIGSIGDKLIGIGGNTAAKEIELVIEGGVIEKRENLIKDLIGMLNGNAN